MSNTWDTYSIKIRIYTAIIKHNTTMRSFQYIEVMWCKQQWKCRWCNNKQAWTQIMLLNDGFYWRRSSSHLRMLESVTRWRTKRTQGNAQCNEIRKQLGQLRSTKGEIRTPTAATRLKERWYGDTVKSRISKRSFTTFENSRKRSNKQLLRKYIQTHWVTHCRQSAWINAVFIVGLVNMAIIEKCSHFF